MPVIRINSEKYILLKAKAKEEDRPLSRVITRILAEALGPKPNPKLKEKKVHPLFNTMKGIYTNVWRVNNSFDYRWNGAVDATALNRLIKNLEGMTDKSPADLFRFIMNKLPTFYKDKTINAINKNLNGIIAEIKNGGNKRNKVQVGGDFDFST